MCETMSQNRVHAGPSRQDLQTSNASGGGIAAMRGRDGTANLDRGAAD